jgi:CHAT domain-containing protein
MADEVLRRARRYLVLLLGGALAACSSPPEPASQESPRTLADVLPILAGCPAHEATWIQAEELAQGRAAREALDRAAAQAEAVCPARWEPTWFRGEMLFHATDYRAARAFYDRALLRARALRDAVGETHCLTRLGFIDYTEGALPASLEQLHQAVELAGAIERDDLRAFALNNLAGTWREQGKLSQAAAALAEASTLFERKQLRHPARIARYNEGVLLLSLGDLARAEAVFLEVRSESETHKDARRASLAAISLGHIARIRGELNQASAWFARATSELPQVAISRAIGEGRVWLAQSQFHSAATQFEQAQRLAREHGILIDALLAETFRAQCELGQGEAEQASRRLERLERAAEAAGLMQEIAWIARWQRGKVAWSQRRTSEAAKLFESAIGLIEAQGDSLDPMSQGLHFLLDRFDPLVDLAALRAEQVRRDQPGAAARLLQTIEKAHARTLRKLVGAAGQPQQPVSLAQLQRMLSPDDLVIDYVVGSQHSVGLALSREHTQAFTLPGAGELRTAVQQFHRAVQQPLHQLAARTAPERAWEQARPQAESLRAVLLEPIAALVDRASRIFVIPDGELALVPFAALPDRVAGRFLGDRFEFAYLPAVGDPSPAIGWRPEGSVLVAGDPLMAEGSTLRPLMRAREEIDAVRAPWNARAAAELSREQFTIAQFTARLSERPSLIHLATHAEASTRDRRRCHIAFSNGEQLGFDAIPSLPLRGSWVVLSACRTGEGEAIPGEGMLGLGWAFMAAGVHGLVVSQWSVSDAAAAALMTSYHTALARGVDPMRALSLAQRQLRSQHSHPAFWAPFIVVVNPHLSRQP